jgi:malate dehydrogenase
MFGPDQPVILQLHRSAGREGDERAQGRRDGAGDCAFPLLQDMVLTSDPNVGFKDANWCCLVGAKPRGPGMERPDLLKDNGKILSSKARSSTASRRTIAASRSSAIREHQLHDRRQRRASACRRIVSPRWCGWIRTRRTQLAKKAGVALKDVSDVFIFGNHSPTMFSAFHLAKINGKPATEKIGHKEWLQKDLQETVGKRGAAIIAARGASSAASAANALVDHVRDLMTPGKVHSVAVKSTANTASTPKSGPACRSRPPRPAATRSSRACPWTTSPRARSPRRTKSSSRSATRSKGC